MKRLLIANRAEIACRVIRTAHEMGIETVAVYSDVDASALHVQQASTSYALGGNTPAESYLHIEKIIQAALATRSDAIHPGYGFLAENAKFAEICGQNGIKFIGPTPDQIRSMGDKITAKETMIKAGVPVVPGGGGLLESVDHAKQIASEVGYPVILKATAGGGGKGMRVVWTEEELERNYDMAKNEAGASFKNDGIYLEKFVEEPRHIEIQIAGDRYGTVCHLSERDCSIQRRHQKLVEESPSPFMTPELRKAMGDAACKAASAIGYESVGTIEFLVDKHRNFYFMEMNTRIQVEHPITEEVTDFDLIKEQIKVAAGEKISGKNYYPKLYAMECRINAEDPANGFRPSPGKIVNLHLPGGRGVRIDSHVYAGYVIPQNYDSMIAKLIVSGQSREEVIVRMKRALEEFVIDGIKTTIPFHIALLNDPKFQAGEFTTKFLEDFDFSVIKK